MCKLKYISPDFKSMYFVIKKNAMIISGQPRRNFTMDGNLNLIDIIAL